uniref:Serine/threonine-protein kinase ULK3 n=4 Tax=Lygus hesperus TaxID=30085 RepID=A0A0A9WTA7_LYGHE
MSFQRDPSVEGYDILNRVGAGSYSVVYKAADVYSGEEVAIKCVLKSSLSQMGRDNIITEIQIMKMLKNEFILNMRDFQYDDWYIYLILDYCDGGDLSSFIKSRKKLPENVCKKFMQQLVLGLKFLRSKDITHFDLKPQNLLLVTQPSLRLKIGDFGLSGFLSEETRCNVLKGSPLYMAPEILLGKPVDPKADLWSVGVIFYECLFGEAPLAHSSCRQLVKFLRSEATIPIRSGLSDNAHDLLSNLLVINPEKRISFDDLFVHPFLDLEHYPLPESYLKAVSLARKAVKLDFEKNYLEAFNMYCASLSYLVPFIHTSLTPEKDEFIRKKVSEYFKRAEQLKSILYKAKECIGNQGTITASEALMKAARPQQRPTDAVAPATGSTSQLKTDSDAAHPYRTLKQLALVRQNYITDDESTLKIQEVPAENDIKVLKAMCSSTPKMVDGIDIGLTAQMYLYEGNYPMALDHFKLCLNILVPLLENEPPGQRRTLLTQMTKEWLNEAESAEALILAVEGTSNLASLNQREESCVIQ